MIRSSKIFWVLLVSFSLIVLIGRSSLLMASSGKSHATHFFSEKGPKLQHDESGCYVCHAEGTLQCQSRPLFADDNFFEVTHVCDDCHSPGGTYDGVDDAVIGARNNWTNGVYSGNDLVPGKEKWCASCHDEVPSVMSGVTAPNVVGDEDGSYIYGTGWGYYKTGHGLPAAETYPASGGVVSGGEVACDGCHDFSTSHIDGLARTFDDGESSTTDPSVYRQGYRLNLVGGLEPMLVPWPQNTSPSNSADYYRLCTSCHDSGPFVISSDMNTNLVTDGVNRHEYHLVQNQLRYSADWGGAFTSRMTCVNCHNVHGSTRLAMVRDGDLVGREPGLRIWYYNPDIVTYSSSSPNPPDPEDLPLTASTGTVWSGNSSTNLCSHCHGNNNLEHENRTPFQDVTVIPTLDWTGETNYSLDGVHPDTGSGGTSFEFRVEYTDGNNDAPISIETMVDKNDDGDYLDDGETVAMTEVNAGDTNYTNGKFYNVVMPLNKAGDNTLTYKFAASDSTGSAVQYDPVSEKTITITNAIPVLDWTGQAGYESDGVVPNSANTGSSFEFRVKYTDLDNEAPSSIQVMIDKNDDGDYLDTDETVTMNPYDGDTTYNDGKFYTYSTTLAYEGDGVLDYRFYASDGISVATGAPTSDSTVTVTSGSNNAPILTWTGEANYTTDGVDPNSGLGGQNFGSNFVFRVNYTDANNDAPSYVKLFLDINDDGDFDDANEQQNMPGADPADTDYSDGKIYTVTSQLLYLGDDSIYYYFEAHDGTDPATGDPTSYNTITVIDALEVDDDGPADYSTIQAAIDATSGGQPILVNDGSYQENLQIFSPNSDVKIYTVNGPSATTVNPSSGVGVYFQGFNSSRVVILDGFTIDTASTGIANYGGAPTINNCIITGNADKGIYHTDWSGYPPDTTVMNSTISGNSASSGAGAYFNKGTATFTNCEITGNTSTGNGGGVTCVASNVVIDDSTINSNVAGSISSGGAIYLTSGGSSVTITDTFIQGNSSGSAGGGAIFISDGYIDLTNVMMTGNKTTGSGGAVYENRYGNYLFCTVSGNYAGNLGGAIYHAGTTITTVKNSIFYNNDALNGDPYKQIYTNYKWNYVDVYYTLIDQDPGSGTGNERLSYEDMGGNDTVNAPSFVNGLNPASAPTAGGDYHIESGSPCINAGSASYTCDHDIFGGSRPLGGAYDMGAHEKE